MAKHILLTGGAGFIGSHTYVALVAAGYRVTILDNFENAHRDVPTRLMDITGAAASVIDCDVRDSAALDAAFIGQGFDAVVHFAARKSVAEGERDPLGYYQSNCSGLFNIVGAMNAHNVNKIVFSSSAAVYGNAEEVPITESNPIAPANTYAHTKAIGENFLTAHAAANPEFTVGILRYFNPVGGHPSALIGEDPSQPPNNLVPVLARVATGQLTELQVFGDDYPTSDGTGVRDYIHVMDLADGHVLSLKSLFEQQQGHLVNLGTGHGHSVLEVLNTYQDVCGRTLAYKMTPRRVGDPAVSFADVHHARKVLGFTARRNLKSMCASNWAYVQKFR